MNTKELEYQNQTIDLLLVEDSSKGAELILRELEGEGLNIECRITDSRQGFIEELERSRPAVVLSEFHLAAFDGFEALSISKKRYPQVPFIIVSDAVSGADQYKLLRNKADDLVLKENLTRLPFAVMHALTSANNWNQLQETLESLRQANREKEVLLAEIHHRVKNNLAVISSFVELQRMHVDDREYEDLMGNVLLKIKSIALVHERLYQSSDLSEIDMSQFISDLLRYIESISGLESRGITLRQNGDRLNLDVNQAVPCGLIVSELVNNAIKHAFPDDREGEIIVSFRHQEDEVWFHVHDNGIGIPPQVYAANRTSQGLSIIQALVQQLKAELTVNGKNGTSVQFTFRAGRQKGKSGSGPVGI